MGVTNWVDSGFFPLQDHEDDVPSGMRQQMAGVRIVRMADPSETDNVDESSHTIGVEDDMGTIGDIHPWFFWQTRDRDERATGTWAQSYAAMSVDGKGGPKAGRTGTPAEPTSLLPLGTGVHDLDGRMKSKFPGWPACFPRVPKGVEMIVMPGLEESRQHEVMLHADPRIVGAAVEGPEECGTLIVDLQPDMEMCMDGAVTPGTKGRAARIQSTMRVIALNANSSGPLGAAPFPGVAWNLSLSQQDKLLGYGMCFAKLEGGGGPTTGGPVSVETGPITPGNGRGGGGQRSNFSGGGGKEGAGEGAGRHERDGEGPEDFGLFKQKPHTKHGIGFMAQVGPSGPFTVGSGAGDKHTMGSDADGHPMTSGHLSTNAYFFLDQDYDAPLDFEKSRYPKKVKELPIKVAVHLQYDPADTHRWISGKKPGMWKWWSTSNVVSPITHIKVPTTPPTGGNVTGGPGGPGPNTPGGPGGPGPKTGGPNAPGPITHGGPRTGGGPAPRGGSYGWPGPKAKLPGPRTPSGGGPLTGSGSGFSSGSGSDSDDDDNEGGGEAGIPGGSGGEKKAGTGEKDGSGDGLQIPGKIRGGGYYEIIPQDAKKFRKSWRWRYGKWRPGLRPEIYGDDEDSDIDIGDVYTDGDDDGEEETWDEIPASVCDTVGAMNGELALNQLYHPCMEGFSALSFRAPMCVAGAHSLEHNSSAGFSNDDADCHETYSPSVMAAHAFGGVEGASFEYYNQPEFSRARGGTASGGVMFHPPHLELEDYYGINTNLETGGSGIQTTGWVLAAPGVGFALGQPNADGSLQNKSVVIRADPGETTNDSLQIGQYRSGSLSSLIEGRINQSSGDCLLYTSPSPRD